MTIPEASPSTVQSPEEAQATAVRNQKDSWFLRFPPEIRTQIYIYTFGYHRICLDEPLDLEDTIKYEGQHMVCDHDPIGCLLSITETCRQIHAESALLFFKVTNFGGLGYEPDVFDNFLDSITKEQREAMTRWWYGTCCMTHVEEIDVPLDRLPGVHTLVFEACDRQETSRDVEETRLKDLARQKAGREVTVLFDYTTRFHQNPFYQADVDRIEVRHPEGDDQDGVDSADQDDEDDDIEDEEADEEEQDDTSSNSGNEEEQDGESSDTDDELILI